MKLECATAKNIMHAQMAVASSVGIPMTQALGESVSIKLLEVSGNGEDESNDLSAAGDGGDAGGIVAAPKSKWGYVHARLDNEYPNKKEWDDESRKKFVRRYNNEYRQNAWFQELKLSKFGELLRDRAKQDRKKDPE